MLLAARGSVAQIHIRSSVAAVRWHQHKVKLGVERQEERPQAEQLRHVPDRDVLALVAARLRSAFVLARGGRGRGGVEVAELADHGRTVELGATSDAAAEPLA